MPLIWTGPVEQEKPQYTEKKLERYDKRGAEMTDKVLLIKSADGQLLIPEITQWKSFPRALELTTYITQLSAFQQTLMELQKVIPDPASVSSKPLFEPGTLGNWGPISQDPLGRPLLHYSFFFHSCQSDRN